jgi:hypothetical protein
MVKGLAPASDACDIAEGTEMFVELFVAGAPGGDWPARHATCLVRIHSNASKAHVGRR